MKRVAASALLLVLLAGLLAGCQRQKPDCIALPPPPEENPADLPDGTSGPEQLDGKPTDAPSQLPEDPEESQTPPEDRTVYLAEPPELYVAYDGQSTLASQNSCTWTSRDDATGEERTFCACGVHPLDGRQWLTDIAMSQERTIKLEFDLSPSSAWVCCWPAERIGTDDYDAQKKLIALEDDGTLEIPEGEEGWVFSVFATWDDTYGYGDCNYSFLIEPPAL